MKRLVHIDLSKSDQLARPLGTDNSWVAEHPELLPELTRVWAPCGCVHTILDEMSVLTGCGKESCVFTWELAEQALRDLELAKSVIDIPVVQDLTVN